MSTNKANVYICLMLPTIDYAINQQTIFIFYICLKLYCQQLFKHFDCQALNKW